MQRGAITPVGRRVEHQLGDDERPPPAADPLPPRYRLLVTLVGVAPPIWRRLLVPGDTTLATLHRVLQVALGWEEAHHTAS